MDKKKTKPTDAKLLKELKGTNKLLKELVEIQNNIWRERRP